MESNEVKQATGLTGEDYDEARARALREKLSAPERDRAELSAIEQRQAARREAEARAKAEQRMVGIKRAVGSLLDEYDSDADAVRGAADALAHAIERANGRFGGLISLRDEARALAHRFGIAPPPALAEIVTPAHDKRIKFELPAPRDFANSLQPAVEDDEHRLRQRRTYREVAGTDGYAIIVAAGLPDFAPLTAAQQAIVAARQREQAAAAQAARKFGSEAARLAKIGYGTVHRDSVDAG